MNEEEKTYKSANQLIQSVKEFILLLYCMAKAPEASDDFINNTILGSNGYIQELNEEIAPYVNKSTEYLVELVLNDSIEDYKDINIPIDFDKENMQKYAEYCYGTGYNPRRFDWWAPTDDLQEQKYHAISKIENAAKEYTVTYKKLL